jgi:tRNA threonylcarbamoyladenosine biosynthesis protein TsaE
LAFLVQDEEQMLRLGSELSPLFGTGDLVLFHGELGAGKTTLIRGIIKGLGWQLGVRSPTYNLFSLYETEPPVLHADLYRVQDARDTGIEDYLESHLCLVEWPKALKSVTDFTGAKIITIEFQGSARLVTMSKI